MKILMITPYLPYPLVSGGQIRTYNLLKNLAHKHQITLASFIRSEQEKEYLKELEPFCQKVILFNRRKAWSPINIILSTITPFPFLVSIYFDISVRKKIKEELEKENYNLIHAETFYVMPNIPQTKVPIFLVVGQFKWLPNRDATKFLVKEIWPTIKEKIATSKLWIVGRNPPDDIKNFASADVRVDGDVEDIRLAYLTSDVLLAPIRNGRGTKYKILEAMATKTPIVGTKLAIEGINATNGKQALVAQTAEGLAANTIKVLKDQKLGESLANHAYELVKKDYNWGKISDRLDKVYKEVG